MRRSQHLLVVVLLVGGVIGMKPPVAVRASWSASIPSAPRIQQIRGLACEATALQIALAAKGITVSQDWISAQVGADLRPAIMGSDGYPIRWGNPYQTFVGDINLAMGRGGYGVYQQPIINAARAAGAVAWGGDNWNPQDLYEQVASGNPVVVWVSWSLEPPVVRTMSTWDGSSVWFSRQEHAQTLIGFDRGAGTITLSDPLTASYRTFPMSLFEQRFAQFHGQAVVVANPGEVGAPEAGGTATVAVRGADDQLFSRAAATGWLALGGSLISAPAVVLQADGTPLYLAVGVDHQLYVRSTLLWALLAPPGGTYCVDSPAIAVSGTTIVVGCEGGDRALYVASTTVSPGILPVVTSFADMGQTLWGGPAIAFINGHFTYAVADAARHIAYRTDASGWQQAPYWCVGHPALAVNGHTVLFACEGTDEQAWSSTAVDTFPLQPAPLGGRLIDGAGAAISGTGFEVDGVGTDLQVYRMQVDADGVGNRWHPTGGRVINGVGSA